jgi:putative DNA primase/helicase
MNPLERDPWINIPEELQEKEQWFCWRKELKADGKDTKVPYQARNGRKGSSTNPRNWSSFADATRAYRQSKDSISIQYSGIGFVFNTDYTGIDLDHCVNEDGSIELWAQEIIQRFDTYCEFSPSKTGIHLLCKGLLPEFTNNEEKKVRPGKKVTLKGKNHPDAAIEIYCEGRFFTMTGDKVPGVPETIEDRQEEVERTLQELQGNVKFREKNLQFGSVAIDNDELLNKAIASKDGSKFQALWNGDTSAYGSDNSAADQALCNLLAFWTNRDASRMDFLFRLSGLYRPEKWDRNARSGETYGEGTIRIAIEGCLEGYVPVPQRIEKNMEETLERAGRAQKVANGYKPDPIQVPLNKVLEYLDMNEYGDGLLFSEVFNRQICYDHSQRQWYRWNKHYWITDDTGIVKQLVSGYLGSVYLKAAAEVNIEWAKIESQITKLGDDTSKVETLRAEQKKFNEQMESLRKRAYNLRSSKRCKNVLDFAMSEAGIGVTGGIWDNDPFLLGVTNGVVDLRTGDLRDGYPIDYIRTIAQVPWTGLDTLCPRFDGFMQEIFEDRPTKEDPGKSRIDLIEFLQRLFGFAITGLSSEAVFPLFWGKDGRNGKDTLFSLFKRILGNLVGAVSNDVFLSGGKGRTAGAATPHLVDLQGKRIAWGSETKQGDKLDISQVKLVTGNGAIPARPLFGKAYSFMPTHTLFLMTNNRPHADAEEKAFWSRACVVEFNMRFVDTPKEKNERKKDDKLEEQLNAESSGILAWLVRGTIEYQRQGLNMPEMVKIATEEYKRSEDTTQLFINECCVLGEDKKVGGDQLFRAYKEWCKDNILSPMNGKIFGDDMTKRFKKERTKYGVRYTGIGLITPDYDEPPKSTIHHPTPFQNDYEQASGDALERNSQNGRCRVENDPTPYDKPALQAGLWDHEDSTGVGCVGLVCKVPPIHPKNSHREGLLEEPYTPYTNQENGGDVKQPVEPVYGHGVGSKIPYTNENEKSALHQPVEQAEGRVYGQSTTLHHPTPFEKPEPPNRTCIKCGSQNWEWDKIARNYFCSDCP